MENFIFLLFKQYRKITIFSLNIKANIYQKNFWTRFLEPASKADLMLKKMGRGNVNEQKYSRNNVSVT